MRLAKCLAVLAFVVSVAPTARADKTYGISTLSIDEMTSGSLQTFSLYLKNLRETSPWEKTADRMLLAPVTIRECDIEKFAIVPFHVTRGPIVRDGATYFRCGKKISEFVVDRTGPGVNPMSDDALYAFEIPAPSASESFRFRWTLNRVEIASKVVSSTTSKGRVSTFGFELGSIPFRTRMDETTSTVGSATVDARNYRLEILYDGTWRWGRFEQKRVRVPGKAATYSYRVVGADRNAEMASGAYRTLYSSNIDGNTVGTLGSVLQFPGDSFPPVVTSITVTQ